MKKDSAGVDWTMAEDDEAWQISQAAAVEATHGESKPAGHSVQRKELVFAAMLAACLLLLIGAWLVQRPSPAPGAGAPRSTSSVQSHAPDEQALTQTIEGLDTPTHVDEIQRLGDHLMAQVTVKVAEGGGTRAYRQTRFYTKKGDGWQRSAPDPALLGPSEKLEIANFVILYQAVDADAVYEAAPRLEQLYATLRHDLGLPLAPTAGGDRYTIEVATSGVQSLHNVNLMQRKVAVSSPTLLSVPVEMTPATVLYQAVVYPLACLAQSERIDPQDGRWRSAFAHWFPVEDALPLWELWNAGGPLAAGHEALLRWVYEKGQKEMSDQPLPAEADALCRTYQIWQTLPSQLSIPLACPQPARDALPVQSVPALGPLWREQANFPTRGERLSSSPVSNVLTTESVLDYMVATYGRDKLPQLIEAMGEYTTVDTLIPALFGVSVNDFEAGWQIYLAQRY